MIEFGSLLSAQTENKSEKRKGIKKGGREAGSQAGITSIPKVPI